MGGPALPTIVRCLPPQVGLSVFLLLALVSLRRHARPQYSALLERLSSVLEQRRSRGLEVVISAPRPPPERRLGSTSEA